MRRGLVLFVALGTQLAAPSQSQPKSAPLNRSGWVESANTASAVKAGIALPVAAGTLRKTELRQYDQDGADLAARYMSSDQAIQGTVFLSEPTFADTGLAFLSTDEAIRGQWGPATQATVDQLRQLAGVKDAERRVTYEGAKSGQVPLITIASFIRAGSWLAVAQITGPAAQAGEINSDLDALLAGTAFAKGSEPLPAAIITTESCSPSDRSVPAKVTRPQMADGLEFLTKSGALNKDPIRRLCFESVERDGPVALQIFRPVDPPAGPYLTRFYALLGNGGVILEVAESRKERGAFYALRHGVGRATLFGKFNREPSIGQIRALAAAPDKQPAAILDFTTGALVPERVPAPGVGIKMFCDWALNGCVEDKAAAAATKP